MYFSVLKNIYFMKTNRKKILFVLFVLIFLVRISVISQEIDNQINNINKKIENYQKDQDSLYLILEELKLMKITQEISTKGLPKLENDDTLISHRAYCLVYEEEFEQAKWVAHIITPDVMTGRVGRTNDFRIDSLIKSGSSEEEDFFIKTLQPDSSYIYDGFGFDRGHLAPSADFRWSPVALSESYFYSNMSPQRPEFNRGGWADLEDFLRAYVYEKNVSLFVVTGPVLTDSLEVIKRSKNKVKIPDFYFKVAFDEKNNKGIAFLMPNEELTYPTEYYAKTIDEIEKLTGIDFFANIDQSKQSFFENQKEIEWWLPEKQKGDVPPLNPNDLPKNYFNTIQAKHFINNNEKVTICGTVVSTYKSQKGNVFLNLDKQYPNQVFSITIFSSSMMNFTYKPEEFLKGKTICVRGEVSEYNGIPSMIIKNEKQIEMLED